MLLCTCTASSKQPQAQEAARQATQSPTAFIETLKEMALGQPITQQAVSSLRFAMRRGLGREPRRPSTSTPSSRPPQARGQGRQARFICIRSSRPLQAQEQGLRHRQRPFRLLEQPQVQARAHPQPPSFEGWLEPPRGRGRGRAAPQASLSTMRLHLAAGLGLEFRMTCTLTSEQPQARVLEPRRTRFSTVSTVTLKEAELAQQTTLQTVSSPTSERLLGRVRGIRQLCTSTPCQRPLQARERGLRALQVLTPPLEQRRVRVRVRNPRRNSKRLCKQRLPTDLVVRRSCISIPFLEQRRGLAREPRRSPHKPLILRLPQGLVQEHPPRSASSLSSVPPLAQALVRHQTRRFMRCTVPLLGLARRHLATR